MDVSLPSIVYKSYTTMDESGWKAIKCEKSLIDSEGKKWTLLSKNHTVSSHSIDTTYTISGYDPTFEGKLFAIGYLLFDSWNDDSWSETFCKLWDGLSEKTITVKREKEKQFKEIQRIFNSNEFLNWNIGCDLHLKITDPYWFIQSFGKECYLVVKKLNECFDVKLKDPEQYRNLINYLSIYSKKDTVFVFIEKLCAFLDLNPNDSNSYKHLAECLMSFFVDFPRSKLQQVINELETSLSFICHGKNPSIDANILKTLSRLTHPHSEQQKNKIANHILILLNEKFIQLDDVEDIYCFLLKIDGNLISQAIKLLNFYCRGSYDSYGILRPFKNGALAQRLTSENIPILNELAYKGSVNLYCLEEILKVYEKYKPKKQIFDCMVPHLCNGFGINDYMGELFDLLKDKNNEYLDKYAEVSTLVIKLVNPSKVIFVISEKSFAFKSLIFSTIAELEFLFDVVSNRSNWNDVYGIITAFKGFQKLPSLSHFERGRYTELISESLQNLETKELILSQNDYSFKSGWEFALRFKEEIQDVRWLINIAAFGKKLDQETRDRLAEEILGRSEDLKAIDSKEKWMSLLENYTSYFTLSNLSSNLPLLSQIPEELQNIIHTYKPIV